MHRTIVCIKEDVWHQRLSNLLLDARSDSVIEVLADMNKLVIFITQLDHLVLLGLKVVLKVVLTQLIKEPVDKI